jgi:hypothetical protein
MKAMATFIDLTGTRSGRLTVLHPDNSVKQNYTRPQTYWACRCDCGNTLSVRGCNLRAGKSSHHTKSCGCLQKEIARSTGKQTISLNTPRNDIYSAYRTRAKKLGLQFDLTQEAFATMSQQSCVYCGLPPSTIRKHYKLPTNFFVYNGIDRVDSSVGYVEGNMVTCCETCNKAKRDLPLEVFLAWVKRVANYIQQPFYATSINPKNHINPPSSGG